MWGEQFLAVEQQDFTGFDLTSPTAGMAPLQCRTWKALWWELEGVFISSMKFVQIKHKCLFSPVLQNKVMSMQVKCAVYLWLGLYKSLSWIQQLPLRISQAKPADQCFNLHYNFSCSAKAGPVTSQRPK